MSEIVVNKKKNITATIEELEDMAQRYTLEEIGEELELSIKYVYQLLKKHGIKKKYVRRTA